MNKLDNWKESDWKQDRPIEKPINEVWAFSDKNPQSKKGKYRIIDFEWHGAD